VSIVTEYPLWFLVFCFLVGLLYAVFLYRKLSSDLHKAIRYVLFAARFITVSLLCFFLLNPLVKSTSSFTERPIIIIAADNSASIRKNKDSAFYKKDFPAALVKLDQALTESYDVHFMKFAGEVASDTTLNFSGRETNISAALSQIRNNYEGKNVGAVILATDGLYNKGNNPLNDVERSSFPVFTLALGDTTAQKDAFIKKINHNQTAYIGNKFPVEVQIQASDLQGKEAVVTISRDGQKLATQMVKYLSKDHLAVLNFLLDADKPGLQRYTVNVSVVEGEQNKQNNSMSFVVDVIDKREKILIVAGAPHPDISALKQAIESNQSYEVEVTMAENFQSSLKPYSLVIIHQVDQRSPAAKKLQAELAIHKTSVLQFSRTDFWAFGGVRLINPSPKFNDAEPYPDKGFALFNISNELRNYIKEFPAVSCALATYKVTAGTSMLISQQIGQVQTENPIFAFSDEGGQKSALFCGDGLWRWRLRDFADHDNTALFDELVQKTIQYLSVKADKSFFRVFLRRIINENEPVELDAEVFNPSYELINDPEVNIIITDADKKQFTYTFSKTSNAYHLNAGNFPPGDYSYEAKVKVNNQIFTQRGEFVVKPLLTEFINTAADHTLLYNLSKKTGGEMYYPNQLDALQKKLLASENIKTVIHEQKEVNDFINLKILFTIVLALLSLEWFIRKYNGLY
jgi:hypothetical protein